MTHARALVLCILFTLLPVGYSFAGAQEDEVYGSFEWFCLVNINK